MAAIATLGGAPARFPGGLREVAPRTWAWLQPNGGLGESNAGLIVGDGESLLVDTLWDERLTRRMLDAMALLLADAPLRWAFITHPDGDHWWGNAALGEAVWIAATIECDHAMRREAPPRTLAGMAAVASYLRRTPGRAGAIARRMHAQLAPFHWRGLELRDADWPVGDGATIEVGGRVAKVRSLGPAHTASDAIVQLPDVGVVFAGDLLFIGVTPIMWHGPVETWLAALETLLSLDAEVYVPGHGPPCGRRDVEEVVAYWRWLREGVRTERAAGRSVGEAARTLVRAPEHAQFGDWLNPERILVNVATMYRDPGELSPLARAKLLVQMNALGVELATGRP